MAPFFRLAVGWAAPWDLHSLGASECEATWREGRDRSQGISKEVLGAVSGTRRRLKAGLNGGTLLCLQHLSQDLKHPGQILSQD